MRKALRLLAAIAAVCILTVLTQAQIQTAKATNYKEKVLHAFTGGSDGGQPTDLVRDAKGNLYGATAFGGNTSGECGSGYFQQGCGVVFKLSAAGKFSVLHAFDFNDGAVPNNLIYDASGNLYGTAAAGGNSACQDGGCGVIFKVTTEGDFTLLHRFTGGADGSVPNGLILGAKGNLYGTTSANTSSYEEYGEVFELTTSGQLHVLHSFNGTTHGNSADGVVQDNDGNLYGTTFGGGDTSCILYKGSGCGVVYKLDTSGKETVLYSFKGKSDGAFPAALLVMDKAGNLYGTASLGGDEKAVCHLPDSPVGCGTVFKIDNAGAFSALIKFDSSDGLYPGALTEDVDGIIFGTTSFGGSGCCGVVYKLNSGNKETVVYNFKGQSQGGWPEQVIDDTKGNLYGTTEVGGDLSCHCGVIFELTP
jgi:uncharacterized repeat protein (TIGR03803 family)